MMSFLKNKKASVVLGKKLWKRLGEGIYKFCPSEKSKILTFKGFAQESLSDRDIINLFLGFVKLIKQSAMQEAERKYKEQLSYYTTRLNEELLKKEKNK